jgi:hypothetical protein
VALRSTRGIGETLKWLTNSRALGDADDASSGHRLGDEIAVTGSVALGLADESSDVELNL